MKADIKYFLIIFFFILFPKVALGNNEIKIGLLAPFSGEYEDIGKSVFSSARMALNKINDENINILPRDTKGKNKETLLQVEKLYVQGVRIFIGPVFNKNLVRNLNIFFSNNSTTFFFSVKGWFKLYKSQPIPEYPAKTRELSSLDIVGCCKPVKTLVIGY